MKEAEVRMGRNWFNEGAGRASGNAHGAPELGLSLKELSRVVPNGVEFALRLYPCLTQLALRMPLRQSVTLANGNSQKGMQL